MKNFTINNPDSWKIEKIGVIGPGIVGMPMASLLANAQIKIGTNEPAKVIIIQRKSVNSGWKIDSINKGKSVIGGIEPDLDRITKAAFDAGTLSASDDYSNLSDADVILVSVQTDKKGLEPDYGPLFEALENLGNALKNKPAGNIPVIIFESTLAPTTMDTLIRKHFMKFGLEEGKDILLGNSPNRVMPGRLVERIIQSDKLAGGLSPVTPILINKLYKNIVTEGEVFITNSLTAEIVKTLENAYRDVRIAFSAEIVRFCDEHNIDFYKVRETVNQSLSQADMANDLPNEVPSGGILIPTLGVGGHCLPKDGILLWWRKLETQKDTPQSLILESRKINNQSPILSFLQAEKAFGNIRDKKIALLGVAYRFNSEDTRNSPTLELANYLRENKIDYIMHDPYVKPDDQNLLKYNQQEFLTNDLSTAVKDAEIIILGTAHKEYLDQIDNVVSGKNLMGVMDACNIYKREYFEQHGIPYTGIGRGKDKPTSDFIAFVTQSFQAMETGLANELSKLINFYNENYAFDLFNKVEFSQVQKLAKTCSTGCEIADVGKIDSIPVYHGFSSKLVKIAFENSL
ncbi:UDP-N-acetyl-D-mannosamine dehydrogenase [Draconibacterium sp.]